MNISDHVGDHVNLGMASFPSVLPNSIYVFEERTEHNDSISYSPKSNLEDPGQRVSSRSQEISIQKDTLVNAEPNQLL